MRKEIYYIDFKGSTQTEIYLINVELTSTFLLYRSLVHHHHRILNQKFKVAGNHKDRETVNVKSVQ